MSESKNLQTPTKKYAIVSLGCRTNQYEGQGFATQLQTLGFEKAGEGEFADLCIVNTCTVTESADSGSRQAIRQLARKHPHAKIAVTGCLAERAKEELEKIRGVFVVVPNEQKERLLEKIFPEEVLPEFRIHSFEGHSRAFVKVQDGCNSFCTYCIIPYVRGRSRSRAIPDILQEIHLLVASGYKEVVLTGINIGDFRGENGERLADLVKLVDQIEGVLRIRISSIDPDEVDDELMGAVMESQKSAPSMHIVLQSGSNRILKKMNRKYTKQMFLESVRKLKRARSEFTFTTDVIVGFPGETDRDFEETLEVIDEVGFAKVHMFPYSPREKTRAALYPGRILPEIMQARKQRVLRLAEKKAFFLRESFIGKKVTVLVEQNQMGYTEHFLPIQIKGENLQPKDLVEVTCIANEEEMLIGIRN